MKLSYGMKKKRQREEKKKKKTREKRQKRQKKEITIIFIWRLLGRAWRDKLSASNLPRDCRCDCAGLNFLLRSFRTMLRLAPSSRSDSDVRLSLDLSVPILSVIYVYMLMLFICHILYTSSITLYLLYA